jgi:transcription antitermination factor NusG
MVDRWYAAKAKPTFIPYRLTGPVQPHPFTYALRNLVSQGFTTYCPTKREHWVWHGKKRERERTIFNNYLFVMLDLRSVDQKWRKINSTRGIIRLLPIHSEFPDPLPNQFVPELQDQMAAAEVALLGKRRPRCVTGSGKTTSFGSSPAV